MTTDAVVLPTTLVAISGEEYQQATGDLKEWLRGKIAHVGHEIREVDKTETAARERNFHPAPYDRMRKALVASCVWYEKLLAAIEAGYTLMPDLPLQLFAIRTDRKKPPARPNVTRNETEWRRNEELQGQTLPIGEGRYVSSTADREIDTYHESDDKGKAITVRHYENVAHQGVALPITLTKPELIEAVGDAVERRIFDEIGLCVPQRSSGRGDPLVMGRIYRDSTRRRAVCFVIGWFVQVRDLV